MKIKDLPVYDRPRERLIHFGVEALSNEELLSLLLKTGSRDESAKALAIRVLNTASSLEKLKEVTYEELSQIKGIGDSKACTLLASIELGRRVNTKPIIREQFTNPAVVFNYYKNIIGDKNQEHFCCVYLDNKKRIIRDKTIFIGTLNFSPVHPREIFKEAYILSASSIICVHNHPSDNVNPSKEDIITTKRLIEVGKILGIPIIDHIIIGYTKYYSLLEQGDI